MKNLEYHLFSKHKLKFNNGKFKVLMMSDIQEGPEFNEKSLRSMNILLDESKPDLVLLGGDNCFGPYIHNVDDLKKFLGILTEPMESRKIPWAHVFGNHDHDVEVDDAFHQELYEAYPFCISKHTESDVHGTTNFVLPVYDSEDKVAFCVWGLDTNNLISEYDDMVPSGDMCKSALLPQMPVGKGRWSIPHFDQLMWYWNTSRALEAHCGKKIPGMLCMHMPLYEYITAAANPEICVKDGVHGEPADPGFLNCGLFAEILQRGDIKTIGCGHTHCNDYEAEYCGIKLCWDGCAGYTAYGIDERRGGRVFEFYEDRSFEVNTYMIHTQKMMEEES